MDKFNQVQNYIRKLSEKSIALEEVPGLFKVKKVKSVAEKQSVRVTCVYGSMRAKVVASQVKDIKDKKIESEKAKKKERTKERI